MSESIVDVVKKTYQRDDLSELYDEALREFGATEYGRILIENEDVILEAGRARENGVPQIGCQMACNGCTALENEMPVLTTDERGVYRKEYLQQLTKAELVELSVENEHLIMDGTSTVLVEKYQKLRRDYLILCEAIKILSRSEIIEEGRDM